MDDKEFRVETAIEFMKEGRSFPIGNLRFGINDTGNIEVAGWSNYLEFSNLTKDRSTEELNNTKSLFFRIVNTFPKLKEFIKGKDIEYRLYFNDAGKTSITICS